MEYSNKRIMVDIETTGNDIDTVEILNIAMVSCSMSEDGYWIPGAAANIFIHTDINPSTNFAKEKQGELYRICRETPVFTKEYLKEIVQKFLRHHDPNSLGPHHFMGWNAAGFDMPLLVKYGLLTAPKYISQGTEDVLVGDFHYRILDVQSIYNFLKNIWAMPEGKFDELLESFEDVPKVQSDPAQKHFALNDCYRQIDTLNRLIRLMRGTRGNVIENPQAV